MTIDDVRRRLDDATAQFVGALLCNQARNAPLALFPNIAIGSLKTFLRSSNNSGDVIGLSLETCELLVGASLENMDSYDEGELTPAERVERRLRFEQIGALPYDITDQSLWDRFAAAGRIAAISYGNPEVQFAAPWWCAEKLFEFQRAQGLVPTFSELFERLSAQIDNLDAQTPRSGVAGLSANWEPIAPPDEVVIQAAVREELCRPYEDGETSIELMRPPGRNSSDGNMGL